MGVTKSLAFGTKEWLKTAGKIAVVELGSNAGAYTVGALSDSLGLPLPITLLLAGGSGTAIASSGAKNMFADSDSIVRLLRGEADDDVVYREALEELTSDDLRQLDNLLENKTDVELATRGQRIVQGVDNVGERLILADLSQEEIDAIIKYSGNAYSNINNALRGKEVMTLSNQIISKNLQTALDKARIPHDMVVFRGTSTLGLGSLRSLPTEKLVGKIFMEPGFMSTSTNNSVAGGIFQGNMQMTIEVPAGARGLDISSVSQFATESEILFQSGTEMYIKKAEMVDGVLNIVVKISE
jgi:hypothetical protein